jgi:hypothetical protein
VQEGTGGDVEDRGRRDTENNTVVGQRSSRALHSGRAQSRRQGGTKEKGAIEREALAANTDLPPPSPPEEVFAPSFFASAARKVW